MECYICSERLTDGYLCEKHAMELKSMLDCKKNIVLNPDSRHHCSLCGEFENRIIVKYPNAGYFCNIDIEEEIRKYTK